MNFNPFEILRKKSKLIMSVVTIIVMFIFVLGSGLQGGDFFNDVIPRWFGGKGKNPPLVEIEGQKYRLADLEKIKTQRTFASTFLFTCRHLANNTKVRRLQELLDTPKALNPRTVSLMKDIVKLKLTWSDPSKGTSEGEQQIAKMKYDMEIAKLFNPEQFSMRGMGGSLLPMYLRTLDPKKDSEDIEALNSLIEVMRYDAFRGSPRNQDGYFSQIPNKTLREAALFALFLKKADEMGIYYPPTITEKLLEDEMKNALSQQSRNFVEKRIRKKNPSFPAIDQIIAAVGDEFRVKTVINLMKGNSERPDSPLPSFVTPIQLYDYYKDQCSEISVNFIDIPVEKFLPEVKETPTEEQLQKLYDEFKYQEYDPKKESPGFRESYRVKANWIGAKATNSYYEQNAKVIQAVSHIASGANIPMLGLSALPVAYTELAQPYLAKDLLIYSSYQELVSKAEKSSNWTQEWNPAFHTSTEFSPITLTAIAGQIAPAPLPFPIGNLIPASVMSAVYKEYGSIVENRSRVKVGMPLVLAPFSAAGILPGIITSAANIPVMPPLSFFRGDLEAKTHQAQLKSLFEKDFTSFQAKVKELSKDKVDGKTRTRAEIQKSVQDYVNEFVKARSFSYGASVDLQDQYSLIQDAGMKPLAEAFPESKLPLTRSNRDKWFDTFFGSLRGNSVNQESVFDPIWFGSLKKLLNEDVTKETFMVWISELTPPITHTTYAKAPDRVKAKVAAAWKLMKARELAKKETDRLAEEVRKIAIKQLKEAQNASGFRNSCRDVALGYTLFDIDHIAPLQSVGSTSPTPFGGKYVPYQLQTEYIEEPGAMQEKILELRTKPLGETIVVKDQPGLHFYITTLSDKKEKTIDTFGTDVFGKASQTPAGDPLYSERSQQVGAGFGPVLVDRLKQELKYQETDEMKRMVDKE